MKDINYTKVGDYYIPYLKGIKAIPQLSFFGRRLYKHLYENEQNKLFSLRCENKLVEYLVDTDEQMNKQYELLVK